MTVLDTVKNDGRKSGIFDALPVCLSLAILFFDFSGGKRRAFQPKRMFLVNQGIFCENPYGFVPFIYSFR